MSLTLTGDQIPAAVVLGIRSTLGLEVKTGMKFSNRVNVFKQAKDVLLANGIQPKGTKRAVWDQLNDLMDEAGFPPATRKPY